MSELADQTVCAVVVTFNRRPLLGRCLDALSAQSHPVDHIVVVDNASTDGTLDFVREAYPACVIIALPQNVGGAGGFSAGVKYAAEKGFDWIWLMDDDGHAAPDCLERLLVHRSEGAALVPVQQNSRGELYGIGRWQGMDVNATDEVLDGRAPTEGDYVFAFVGPLICRRIVDLIGPPDARFFIWYDDIEYALRIRAAENGRVVVVPDAIFFHDFGGAAKEVTFLGRKSVRTSQPAWKAYYSARNPLYIITRVRRRASDLANYLRYQLRYAMGELIYEPDRWKRLSFRARGFCDGALGRMGKRVSP